MTVHVSPTTGCNLGCSYSAVPGTRVLTADLTWVPIEELDLHDEVVAFDRPDQTEKNKQSKLRVSHVTATWKYEEEAVRVVTDRGTVVVGESHPFLSKHHGFRDAQDFKPGQEIRHVLDPDDYAENEAYRLGYVHGAFAGDGSIFKNDTTHVATIRCQDPEVVETVHEYAPEEYGLKLKKQTSDDLHEVRTTKWDEVDLVELTYPADRDSISDEDYARGWLAGMFDTDGHFDGKTVKFLQTNEEQRELLQIALDTLGYDYEVEPKCVRVRGQGSRLRVLAEIRPKVPRKIRKYEGRGWKGTATVESVESVGTRVFHDITVDTYHTLVLEGLCSHNCYEEPSREISGNRVAREYDMDAIMEWLDRWKEVYPNDVPGLHGGEPLLMRLEDMETVFDYIYREWNVASKNKNIHVQSNGTLLSDKHVELFKKYDVHMGVSIDGPPDLNVERQARVRNEDATDMMSVKTARAITRCVEEGISVGIIVVLHKSNAGDDEKLEKLLSWMDNLNRMGVSGHYNPAIPYENIQTDISLPPQRLKEVYLRTWEWMNEPYDECGNPISHRTWNPMRDYIDNLLGLSLGNCVNGKCDVFNAGAARIITGDGYTTGCGKTWDQVGDGVVFMQGDSNGSEYDSEENGEERYDMLKQVPGPYTEGEADFGGCKGCRYWNVCQGGCPSAGFDDDYRNRTIWCPAIYALYERIEADLRRMMPNIRMVTDVPWDIDVARYAQRWTLDIKPFAAMDTSTDGRATTFGGAEHPYGTPYDCLPDAAKESLSFDSQVAYYQQQYGEEHVTFDESEGIIHADSAPSRWEKVERDDDSDEDEPERFFPSGN